MLLIVLAILFPIIAPITSVSAAPSPASGTLTIHNYALEDMSAVGLPNDGNVTTNIPSSAVPLSGVEFTVWQVDPLVASTSMSVPQAWQNVLSTTKQTGVTDANGEVTFTLPQGLYYVAETDSSGSSTVYCEPFIVPVPMEDTVTAGNWIANVHVYPKNQSLVIDKFVGAAGGVDYDFTDYDASKYMPVAMNEAFGWSILSSLPAKLGTANPESYVVTDTLGSHFDYVPGSVKVYAVPAMTTPVSSAYELTEGTDYVMNFNTATNTLKIQLTISGIALMGNRYTNNSDRYILIKYDCKLNSLGTHGIHLYSGADVEYARNTTGARGVSYSGSTQSASLTTLGAGTGGTLTKLAAGESSVATAAVAMAPAVHTGQIGIKKLADGTKTPLANAEFGLAVSETEAKAGNFIATGTTDDDGNLAFTGLSYGALGDGPTDNTGNTSYWLVETKAPDGYKLVEDPVEVTFNHQQGETGEYYFANPTVYNVLSSTQGKDTTTGTAAGGTSAKTLSAKTGDTNALYIFSGLLLISLAGVVILLYYRKKKESTHNSRVK